MSNELSELDELIESDVLEALGEKVAEDNTAIEIDGITIEDIEEPAETIQEEPNETNDESTVEEFSTEEGSEVAQEDLAKEVTIEDLAPEQVQKSEPTCEENVQSVTTTDLASLLSELLNNKTIEITIKIKD